MALQLWPALVALTSALGQVPILPFRTPTAPTTPQNLHHRLRN
jgi:hypothetical protein